jgi:hypothetical protein
VLLNLIVAVALLLSCVLVPIEHAIERSRRKVATISGRALANSVSVQA